MCDYCLKIQKQRGQQSSAGVRVNCMSEVKLICEVIERCEEKDKKEKRVTANKLVDLVYSELNNSKKNKSSSAAASAVTIYNNLSKTEIESLILAMLMKKYLKEDFHFTPYNTICYVVNGPKSGRLDYETEFTMVLDRPGGLMEDTSVRRDGNRKSMQPKENGKKKDPEPIKYEMVNDNEDEDDDDCQLIFDQDDNETHLTKKTRRLSMDKFEADFLESKKTKIEMD